ncbi:hypothetical protein J437_LFUL000440 [Ladona fulva]|uniref:Uncharacterized protein n=1 Tax=Ladona fulva TaxID=123851 RepID=A0A8K0K322_LADFU|nr:hypothetical protein J437_LFUL000440 [Ladona fulva]
MYRLIRSRLAGRNRMSFGRSVNCYAPVKHGRLRGNRIAGQKDADFSVCGGDRAAGVRGVVGARCAPTSFQSSLHKHAYTSLSMSSIYVYILYA